MSASTSDQMSTDLVFEILSNPRRRMVLYYLRQYGGSATVQELAGEIAALENDSSVDELTKAQRKRVYVSLYQTHLPKLEETDIIEYDDDRERVLLTNRAFKIDDYLTPSTESKYSWQPHYLVLAIIGGLIFALSFFGVPGFATIPAQDIGIALMIGFVVLTVIQYRQYKKRQQEIHVELLEE
jgi:DNA-binding transcriptional ArsR family regulator